MGVNEGVRHAKRKNGLWEFKANSFSFLSEVGSEVSF